MKRQPLGDHDFLFLDVHYNKDQQPSGFRQNLDTYLGPDEIDTKTEITTLGNIH